MPRMLAKQVGVTDAVDDAPQPEGDRSPPGLQPPRSGEPGGTSMLPAGLSGFSGFLAKKAAAALC